MLHDINQIRSLSAFIKEQPYKKMMMTPYDLFNAWTQSGMVCIQDKDTVEYYMTLIPMIKERERRLSKQ